MNKKVLLISMPFNTATFPSLGISLLKSSLFEREIACDIKYFNIDFAQMVGVELYEKIGLFQLLGERIFAENYFGNLLPGDGEFRSFLKEAHPNLGGYADRILATRQLVGSFLDHCMNSVPWEEYDIIGFSLMFEQNMASVALAERIKQLHPEKEIVFGGANCEAEMGLELHRCFPCVDFVCVGESDISFPDLVMRISRGESMDEVPNIIYRKNGESVETPREHQIRELDLVPYPDYRDYFAQLRKAFIDSSVCIWIPMETSRGCWWGEKAQCRFCGLSPETISFRSKSEKRVLDEIAHMIRHYVNKYQVPTLFMVDNILDLDYFRTLIPELGRTPQAEQIFFEIKSNMTREQVRMLAEAGITWVQPGIESLSSPVLKLMSKGVSGLKNIQLLKDCREFDVYPTWNILTGFPGEKTTDYRQMLEVMSKIVHLPPPTGIGRFALHRFSPYFVSPEDFGIVDIRPGAGYRYVYPFEMGALYNLAYHFEFDFEQRVKPEDHSQDVEKMMNAWHQAYDNGAYLYAQEISSLSMVILDGRPNAPISKKVLAAFKKDIYEYCAQVRSLEEIQEHVLQSLPNSRISSTTIKRFLQEMVSLDYMLKEGDKYLSLAISWEERPNLHQF